MTSNFNYKKKLKYFFSIFFVFSFPVQVLASILDLEDNIPPRAWIGRPMVTGPIGVEMIDVSSGKEVIYRTFYNEQQLIGDIVHEKVAGNKNPNPLPDWISPAGRLLARDWKSRDIFTSKPIRVDEQKGIPFEWASLTNSQKNVLDGGLRSGEKILNYTRGDRGNEFPYGAFRQRTGLLGEIVHSNLYLWQHTSAPNQSTSNPLSMLYVGSNDGMLHAFNAKTGDEVFAYVPSTLLGNLKENVRLRAPGPTDGFLPKPAYVDGQIAIASLHTPGAGARTSGFRTVLVGSLGAGGRGLYALDISDPYGGGPSVSRADKAKKKVMWEITSATPGFGNMGRVYGAPRIAIVNDNGVKKQAVIVGNGYFNSRDNTSLFIINLSDGKLIKEIKVPDLNGVGKVSSLLKPSGLSTPTVHDRDGNGLIDYVYAGDPDGRLWKFDIKDLANSPRPVMLYQAKMREREFIDGLRSRPITTPPIVHYNSSKGKYMVIFGTGMLVRPRHVPLFLRNSLYGIVDDDRTIDDNQLAPSLLRSILPGDTFDKYRVVVNGKRLFERLSKRSTANDDGWYMELPFGERVLAFLPVSNTGRIYMTTNEVRLTSFNGPSWLYVLDMNNGLAPDGCSIFDLDQDGKYCQILAGKKQVDHGDLLLPDRIEAFAVNAVGDAAKLLGINVDTSKLDFELFPGDRKPIAARIAEGLVSQPTLLSEGDGTIFPIFNWNTGEAQRILDLTRFQVLDFLRTLAIKDEKFEYSSVINTDGSIVITTTLVGKKRACLGWFRDCNYRKDVEQIKIEKNGTWSIKRRPNANGPFSKFRCIAHCSGGLLTDDIVGIVGNSTGTRLKMHPGLTEEPPILERKSWRVVDQ